MVQLLMYFPFFKYQSNVIKIITTEAEGNFIKLENFPFSRANLFPAVCSG